MKKQINKSNIYQDFKNTIFGFLQKPNLVVNTTELEYGKKSYIISTEDGQSGFAFTEKDIILIDGYSGISAIEIIYDSQYILSKVNNFVLFNEESTLFLNMFKNISQNKEDNELNFEAESLGLTNRINDYVYETLRDPKLKVSLSINKNTFLIFHENNPKQLFILKLNVDSENYDLSYFEYIDNNMNISDPKIKINLSYSSTKIIKKLIDDYIVNLSKELLENDQLQIQEILDYGKPGYLVSSSEWSYKVCLSRETVTEDEDGIGYLYIYPIINQLNNPEYIYKIIVYPYQYKMLNKILYTN